VERRPIDEMVDNAMGRWAQKIVERTDAQDNLAKNLKYRDWSDVLDKAAAGDSDANSLIRTWESSSIKRTLDNAEDFARQDYEQVRDHRNATDRKIEAAGGVQNGKLPPSLAHLESSYLPRKTRPAVQYPRDPNGVSMPPEELVKMHAAVQAAGEAIHADLQEAIRTDPEIRRLQSESDFIMKNLYTTAMSGMDRMAKRKEAQDMRAQVRKRERELVVDALDQFREMGGGTHSSQGKVVPVTSRSGLDALNRSKSFTARKDWRAQLEETDKHLPTDWVQRSAREELNIISDPRAYHAQTGGGDWRSEHGNARRTTLAMNTDKGAENASYDGAFPSYVHEVTFHEMGHRMEVQIPGLKALEFAYVRSKTTKGGKVEPRVKLKDLYGGGYRDTEEAYKDEFADAYTGKTYEGNDPANAPWEAFQVGLQQTFGRGSRRFGDDTLEHFVLGVMATVGRS
jgi:hypothetical protein